LVEGGLLYKIPGGRFGRAGSGSSHDGHGEGVYGEGQWVMLQCGGCSKAWRRL
jgi:hypothetical protein